MAVVDWVAVLNEVMLDERVEEVLADVAETEETKEPVELPALVVLREDGVLADAGLRELVELPVLVELGEDIALDELLITALFE